VRGQEYTEDTSQQHYQTYWPFCWSEKTGRVALKNKDVANKKKKE